MPSCCISGCESSSWKVIGDRKPHLFKAKTAEIFELWKNAIPHIKNVKKYYVCDLHFEEGDIITHDVLKLADGNIFRSKRDRVILKEGAIPTKFPEEHAPKMIVKSIPLPPVKAYDVNFGKESDFEKICGQCDSIPLPSEYWFLNRIPNAIAINKWSNDRKHCLLTRLLINADKTINIYSGKKEINLPEPCTAVVDVNDIVQLLEALDKILPCMESDEPRAENCVGFVLQKGKGMKGPQGKYCMNCKTYWRKNRPKAKIVNLSANLKLTNKERGIEYKTMNQDNEQHKKRILSPDIIYDIEDDEE